MTLSNAQFAHVAKFVARRAGIMAAHWADHSDGDAGQAPDWRRITLGCGAFSLDSCTDLDRDSFVLRWDGWLWQAGWFMRFENDEWQWHPDDFLTPLSIDDVSDNDRHTATAKAIYTALGGDWSEVEAMK